MKATPVTKDQIKQIMHLYGKGDSGRSIAAALGLLHATVHKTISTNSLKITGKKAAADAYKKSIGKSAKSVTKTTTRHTFTPFTPPPDAPICNATVISEPYRCPELNYRQPSRV